MQRCCLHSTIQTTTCLILESASLRECGSILTCLYPSIFSYFGGTKGKFKVYSSINGDKSFTATKGGRRPALGKQASHFAIKYVVVQCCQYQRSVAAVLKNVVFCSKWLLYFSDRNYPGLPYGHATRYGMGILRAMVLLRFHPPQMPTTGDMSETTSNGSWRRSMGLSPPWSYLPVVGGQPQPQWP